MKDLKEEIEKVLEDAGHGWHWKSSKVAPKVNELLSLFEKTVLEVIPSEHIDLEKADEQSKLMSIGHNSAIKQIKANLKSLINEK